MTPPTTAGFTRSGSPSPALCPGYPIRSILRDCSSLGPDLVTFVGSGWSPSFLVRARQSAGQALVSNTPPVNPPVVTPEDRIALDRFAPRVARLTDICTSRSDNYDRSREVRVFADRPSQGGWLCSRSCSSLRARRVPTTLCLLPSRQ